MQDANGNGRKQHKPFVYVLAGILSGMGGSVSLPFLAPGLYRHDPAYGRDVERLEFELKSQIQQVQAKVELFALVGPDTVRDNQAEMKENQEEIIRLLSGIERSISDLATTLRHGRSQ